MKSSLPTGQAGMTKISHIGMIVNHAKILPKVGIGYPEKPEQIMSIEKKL
jgi:hypothetical protein